MSGKFTLGQIEEMPNDSLVELVETLRDQIDDGLIPEGFFEDPESITEQERSELINAIWEAFPPDSKQDEVEVDVRIEEIPDEADEINATPDAPAEPAPKKGKGKGKGKKGRPAKATASDAPVEPEPETVAEPETKPPAKSKGKAKAPKEATPVQPSKARGPKYPKLAQMEFSELNPLGRGSINGVAFEMSLRKEGVTLPEFRDVCREAGVNWKDVGYLAPLGHLKYQGNTRPKALPEELGVVRTTDLRNGKPIFRVKNFNTDQFVTS